MDNNISLLHGGAENRKRAYFAMCRVSLLLLFFAFSSRLLSFLLAEGIEEYGEEIRRAFTAFFRLFNVDTTDSYAAANMIMSSPALYEVLSFVISFVSFVLPALFFCRCTGLSEKESFVLKGGLSKSLVSMFFLCQLFTMTFSAFAQSLYGFLAPDTAIELTEAATGVVASEFNVYEFAVRVLCTCVIVPLIEEFAFRGVIFTYLRKYGLCFAAVASAAVFGVAHSSPVQSVYAFSFGLFSAFLFVVTKNLKTSILFHAVNNLITVCMGYVLGSVEESVFGIVNCVFIMAVSVLGIAGLYRVCTDGGYMSEFCREADENDAGLDVKPGLFQVMAFPFAAYVLFYIFEIVSNVLVSL